MALIGTNAAEAAAFLRSGSLVGIPTETVYGLAGNALDPAVVSSIFEVKNRPSFDPLIIHVHSVERLPDFTRFLDDRAAELARRFWPGPLTLLLPKRNVVPDLVTSGLDQVAVRVPAHPLTLELLTKLDFPLAAPSANPFGYISPVTAQHVADQLGEKIPFILDGGVASIGVESTIIGFPAGAPTVYRLGGLAIEEIEKAIGPVRMMPHSSSNPQAPGMLKSHYAPRKPFRIVDRKRTVLPSDTSDMGYLVFETPVEGVDITRQRVLAPGGTTAEAAQNLFRYLRELDTLPVSRILAELVPDKGLGRAVNDRLKRAAAGSTD